VRCLRSASCPATAFLGRPVELVSSASPAQARCGARDRQSGELLAQVTSVEEADQKIDALAAAGRVTPALLLTMAKAYAGVRETDMTKEEVKDIMAHLYFKASPGADPGALNSCLLLSNVCPLHMERCA